MREEGEQPINREGAWAQQAESNLSERRLKEDVERGLANGLESAGSIRDRTISTFVRGELPISTNECTRPPSFMPRTSLMPPPPESGHLTDHPLFLWET